MLGGADSRVTTHRSCWNSKALRASPKKKKEKKKKKKKKKKKEKKKKKKKKKKTNTKKNKKQPLPRRERGKGSFWAKKISQEIKGEFEDLALYGTGEYTEAGELIRS